ncbi:MAG: ABC transporter permease [Acidimicrobiia bacterium]
MFRLTLKGVWAHKVRFLLTGIAVVLGVSFISGSFIFTDTLTKIFDDIVSSANARVDAVVRSSQKVETTFGDQRSPIGETALPAVESAAPGVQASGLVQVTPRLVGKDGKQVGAGGNGPPTLGYSWTEVPALNPWRLLPGSEPPRADDQIVVDEATAKSAKFAVGDTVTVLTPQSKPYKLVGIAKFGASTSLAGANIVLFTLPEAQRISQLPGQYSLILATEGGVDSAKQQQLVNQINDGLVAQGTANVEVITGDAYRKEQQDQFQQFIDAFRVALLVFAGISLFVGTFIIFNTFSIVITQRLRELALLRAIGAGGRQVTLSVLGESLLVGVLASIVGTFFGVLLTFVLRTALNAIGAKLPAGDLIIAPRTFVVAMSVGVVVTVGSSILPAIRAARTPPVAAMRDLPEAASARPLARTALGVLVTVIGFVVFGFGLFGKFDNSIYAVGAGAGIVFIGVFLLSPVISTPMSHTLGAPLRAWRGIAGQLAQENAVRNPRRTATTAAAVMIAVALVALITIFAGSLNATVDKVVSSSFRSDFVVNSGDFPGMSPDYLEKIQQLPEVEPDGVAPLRIGFQNSIIEKGKPKATLLLASDPKALAKNFDLGANDQIRNMSGNEMAVTKRIAQTNQWTIGSKVDVVFAQQGQAPTPVSYTIVALMRDDALGPRGGHIVPIDSAFGQYVRPVANFQVYVKLKPDANVKLARTQIQDIVKSDPSVKVQDQTQFRDARKAEVSRFVNIIYALLGLALIIAFIGIANTLALSIYERIRELGLLRAVGMTRKQVRVAVRWESVIIAIFGTLLGLVLGFAFGWGLVRALKDRGITEFAVPVGQLVVIVLIAWFLSVIAAALPARRASRLNVLDAIAHE